MIIRMGFGICSLGYLMIIFDSIGGGLIGWPLLAYGFWKLSSVNKSFKTASVLSILALEYSVVNFLVICEFISDEKMFYRVSYAAYLAIMAALHYAFMMAIRQTAQKGGSAKLANGAASRLYMTEVFYFWALIIIFLPSLNTGTLSMLLILFRYCVGFINLLFLYTCYAQITTASQMEKEI
ncbi:MAG: hypothetical protein PHW77_07635, partial [Eubacteriales bacterium]|nr:hypothetical protein [Eubacteriales bacterium]